MLSDLQLVYMVPRNSTQLLNLNTMTWKRRSCETQLIMTCHDLAKVVNDSGQVDMLVLDFAKVKIDTVAHKRLLVKLESYGIDATCTDGYSRFLREELEEWW